MGYHTVSAVCSDLQFDQLNWWQAALISLGIGLFIAVLVQFWLGKKIRQHAESKTVIYNTASTLK